jgi:hypothetical protein
MAEPKLCPRCPYISFIPLIKERPSALYAQERRVDAYEALQEAAGVRAGA